MRWPEEVIDWMRENIPGRTTKEVVELANQQGFDRKYNMVFTDVTVKSAKNRYKINSGTPVGLPKGTPSKRFPREIKEYIESNYQGVGPKEMAERLNNRYQASYTRQQLKAYYANHNLRSGVDTRWKEGNIPYNKGKKMPPEQYEKCKATMFKKGRIPANQMKIGDRTHTTDGYLLEKVSDAGSQRERFAFVHRMVWEQHYGPIPKGKMITFLDGDKDNCEIDNLVMIDEDINLILNHKRLRFDDPELTKTGVAIARMRAAAKRRANDRAN